MRKRIHDTAMSVTKWVGSPTSIVIHSILFIGAFLATLDGIIQFDRMLLFLTTVVSLEAIYLSIFIQMTINYTTQSIQEVEENIGEMQEDIGEIQEDMGELQEDVEEIVEEDESEKQEKSEEQVTLDDIQSDLRKLAEHVEKLKNGNSEANRQ